MRGLANKVLALVSRVMRGNDNIFKVSVNLGTEVIGDQ